MLILTRRIGEALYIGDDVRVVVFETRGSYVRLGILAPKEIAVHREEVYERIKREKGSACPAAPTESTPTTQREPETVVVARKVASGR